MLFNTYEPGKFAFSHESVDYYDLINSEDNLNGSSDFSKSKKWGIIGVPFDSTCSYHHGSRYAPTIIREASFGLEQYNSEFDKLLDGEFYDCGDLNVVHGNCKRTCEILEDSVNDLIEANIKPIIIGGEHSVTLGSVNALSALEDKNNLNDITVIHLDAHRDIIDEYIGEKYSHATIMKRIYDLEPKELIQIGIRSFSEEERDFVEDKENIISFYAKDIKNQNIHLNEDVSTFEDLLSKLDSIEGKVYISIDMDVFDPSVAPSVGNPTPNGLFLADVQAIFEALSFNEEIDIIGFDLVELASDRLGDISGVLAAKVIYDFLTLFA
ncbi:arginase/agmatinase family protein [Methanobrevibacter ruminantium M1]|uniref:Arginase/agmatinase family protein n=1 Tax=Methanobrevibacter ruminantium (strain ATCC 35063 / DSM 1093 / JCM 13430 / OCM 146 / M1) TaxID=634498 RepID=D3DZ41_METRM|nr:agmatinase [Methanobrevibacter ruminantium]ADC47591.1 arginase/agmatinase family protein [Methanobrevibacter ruminantium M1]